MTVLTGRSLSSRQRRHISCRVWLVMSVVLSWEKERSPVVRVVVVKLLVRWEWVRGKVHVVVDLLVVVWRRVVDLVDVAGL